MRVKLRVRHRLKNSILSDNINHRQQLIDDTTKSCFWQQTDEPQFSRNMKSHKKTSKNLIFISAQNTTTIKRYKREASTMKEHSFPTICTLSLLTLVQLFNTPVTHATTSNITSVHEIVRHTATSSSEIQFSKLVKLDPNSPNVRSSQHLPSSSSSTQNPSSSKYHNQSISDLSPTGISIKPGDIQTDQKKALFEKICIGTSNKLSVQSNKIDHYQNLVERYRNCTYVIGNLELTWLNDTPEKPLDMSFLESIREITGYLFIAQVNVEKIRIPNLQIIRGRDLYRFKDKDEFAIMLMFNSIKSLELPNLREILAGGVGSVDNKNLCHFRTINWDEILNTPYRSVFDYNTFPPPECPPCDKSCEGSCWGEGPDMCQKYSKTTCAPQCNQGRCFGSAPRECCHLFCAGGCTGPKQTDCLACKNFYDDGECIQECPPMQKYNPSKFSWEPNPKGKYAYGANCVKECPDHLLRDNGACVRTCPPNKRSLNGECLSCSGPCPKECQGDLIHSGNIDRFVNCTIIEGSISILETSFGGFTEFLPNNSIGARYRPMHPRSLIALKNVREITGYLNIQASHPDFTDLSYLRKLEIIGGRQTYDMLYALTVFKTSLSSLNLRSLKKIKSGKVIIEENRNLCFEDTDKWLQANITQSDDLIIRNNGDSNECQARGLHCHAQCGHGGCWGPGADECRSCNNYRFEESCVVDCPSTILLGHSSFDTGNRTCKRCHSECLTGCNGTESSDCFQCRNVKDGPYCVSECPSHKFNNRGSCEECDKGCAGSCTGPSNILGSGGCNSCGKVVLRTPNSINGSYCIKADEPCPEGYYTEYIPAFADGHLKMLAGKPVCRKCHHRCKSCTGMGTHLSVCECAKFVAGEQCEDTCPRDYYADARSRHCYRCSQECNGCYGPTEMDCVACRVYRVFPDGYKPEVSITANGKPALDGSRPRVKFNCTAHCPPEKPHRISDSNLLDPYCSENPGNDIVATALVSTGSFIFFLIFASVLIPICGLIYRCKIEKDKTVKLAKSLLNIENRDVEPLKQSHVKPNLSSLTSIKETELRLGKVLGSGYGGTVYQGLWFPEGQEHIKKPVAIKILHDNGQANMNKEFLDEAYIMASVKHPNLVSLLAVCETPTQLMLVTPLIPLGCLLDYVRTNKNNIDSKKLLEWSKQVAKGMAYLEEHRMVHRDLALRNVLLQTSSKAVISDFGLAKFLDVDQNEYHSAGGRLPIKWLAPECIKARKFTHKSDVWAFGVTAWELLSFGKVPYENYEARNVPAEIESGLRLPHPEGVSMEVFKELLSCWSYNPENRPCFRDLADRFVNFARDPERYLKCNTKGIDDWKGQDFGRNHDSGENVFDEYDDGPQLHSALLDLVGAASNHNSRNESIGFELRHHSETEGMNGQHVSNPTSRKPSSFPSHNHQSIDDDPFLSIAYNNFTKPSSASIKDLNNNSLHSSSTNFITNVESKRVEPPTDGDDYLLPSPASISSNNAKFTKFLETRGECATRLRPASPSPREPPHSAGLIGVSNAEYFTSQRNYVSSSGAPTNASSGHIPHSLV